MLSAHTVEQVRQAEAAVAADIGWETLMQRAARGLADRLADLGATDRVAMLIGPGNNGGDALYAAVHLRARGVGVTMRLLDPDRVHDAGLRAARAAGAEVTDRAEPTPWVIDALFGIGARGGLRDRAARWATELRDQDATVIAVDLPSGVDADTGRCPGAHVRADRTVTFGTYKPGLLVGPAARAAGRIELVDLGMAAALGPPALEALEPGDATELWSLVPVPSDHKYTRGVVGVAAGSSAYAGAAHLCVGGAQAGPAGMVRFLGDPALTDRVVDRAPEVVAGRGRVQAWVVGPGAGDDVADRLSDLLTDGVPLVVDAAAVAATPAPCPVPAVLTPHAGELAAALGLDRSVVEADPLTHAERASRRWQATVLLKGDRTVIASPGRVSRVNVTGTPWLATAGSGDVLAGLVGSLLAAGADPGIAASWGAWLHGRAAELLDGPLVASELIHASSRALSETLSVRMPERRTAR